MAVSFELDGQPFTALNGGPAFTIGEAISLRVNCDSQDELARLAPSGDPFAQQCGWLKDGYGVSWQALPTQLAAMLADAVTPKTERVMSALLGMQQLNLAALRWACDGD